VSSGDNEIILLQPIVLKLGSSSGQDSIKIQGPSGSVSAGSPQDSISVLSGLANAQQIPNLGSGATDPLISSSSAGQSVAPAGNLQPVPSGVLGSQGSSPAITGADAAGDSSSINAPSSAPSPTPSGSDGSDSSNSSNTSSSPSIADSPSPNLAPPAPGNDMADFQALFNGGK
jgi:hypothetical protein